MAIGTTTGGERLKFAGTFQSVESMTQSTSTVPQALSLNTDVSILGAGTATGTSARNIYTLGTGVEGQEKTIYMTATGEASVVFTQPAGRLHNYFEFSTTTVGPATVLSAASATGQYVLQAADDFVLVKWLNDAWQVMAFSGATLGTTT